MTEQKIPLNLYLSIRNAYVHPDDIHWYSFDELYDFFADSVELLDKKEDGLLFNNCGWRPDPEFAPRGAPYIRRCHDNVSDIYTLIIDVDEKLDYQTVLSDWHPYDFIFYTTWSNSAIQPKFRMIVPLLKPLTLHEWEERNTALKRLMGLADTSSITVSQAFFLPAYNPHNRDIFEIFKNDTGTRFDAHSLETEVINRHTPVAQPVLRSADARIMYETLWSGRDMHYESILTLAVLCISRGITESEYITLVKHLAAADSDIRNMTDAEIAQRYRVGHKVEHLRKQTIFALLRKLNCDMKYYRIIP